MESSELLRLERYMTFHLEEIVEDLNSEDEFDSDAESSWSAQSSSTALKQRLLRSRDEIISALVRMQEGTYGNCIACGKQIDLRRLEKVPWLELCATCQSKS